MYTKGISHLVPDIVFGINIHTQKKSLNRKNKTKRKPVVSSVQRVHPAGVVE